MTHDPRCPIAEFTATWGRRQTPADAADGWGACECLLIGRIRADERERMSLLHDYDPVPGLVARGVMSDDHDPESCEADCCFAEAVAARLVEVICEDADTIRALRELLEDYSVHSEW